MSDEGSGGGRFATGLLLGLLAGATLAMIAAPQSGEATRERLRAKAREAADQARETAGGVSERGRTIVERARARVEGAVAEGIDAAEQQRNELESRT